MLLHPRLRKQGLQNLFRPRFRRRVRQMLLYRPLGPDAPFKSHLRPRLRASSSKPSQPLRRRSTRSPSRLPPLQPPTRARLTYGRICDAAAPPRLPRLPPVWEAIIVDQRPSEAIRLPPVWVLRRHPRRRFRFLPTTCLRRLPMVCLRFLPTTCLRLLPMAGLHLLPMAGRLFPMAGLHLLPMAGRLLLIHLRT